METRLKKCNTVLNCYHSPSECSFNDFDLNTHWILLIADLESPPSSWTVLCSPDEPEAKVLMAVDRQIYEMDSFQHKLKVCN